MTDEELLTAFETAILTPETFTHEKHVRLGWIYCQKMPLADALSQFSLTLKALVKKVGAEGKYHETITWFYMLLINERSNLHPADSSQKFVQGNMDLVCESSALISQYYTKKLLASDEARTHYMLPDKLANVA